MPVEFSVVIPVYNEKDSLNELFARLVKVLDKMKKKYETIFVDDGSVDGSSEILDSIKSSYSNVEVYHLEQHTGQSAALYYGVKKAKGKYIITLDADLQNAPEDIPNIAALRHKFDMVCGIRQKRHDSYIRIISSYIAYLFRNLFLRDGIIDTGCSLKLFRKELVKYLIPFKGLHRFLPNIAQIYGLDKIAQVSVAHSPRAYGKTKYNIFNRLLCGIFDTLGIFWLKIRYMRTRVKKGS